MFTIRNMLFKLKSSNRFASLLTTNSLDSTIVEISPEVRHALQNNQPLVALESTIITHGMPFPDNIACAIEVEKIVRDQGAIPATIALMNGKIKAGLNIEELERLGDVRISKPIKTSRRDFSFIIGNKLNGGTTVSGTLIVANKLGIPIFATGGIGGVHREGQRTFDISADLTELGRSNVAVVSSGVKSILDIPKTLEYLETQGVLVTSFGNSKEFPAFYSRQSGCEAPYSVPDAISAAKVILRNCELQLNSGMLFAVPVPIEYELDKDLIEEIIQKALKEASENGIVGKQITPFLLKKIVEFTGGKSLSTNIALIKNNARVAANIATELAILRTYTTNETKRIVDHDENKREAVVIGGSNLDCLATLESTGIQFDGRIHMARLTYSAGGVARNIADMLCKLGSPPTFISAIGNDAPGQLLKPLIPAECRNHLITINNQNTGQCIVVIDPKGDCSFLLGDMSIHRHITPDMISEYESTIRKADIIVLDANLSIECLDAIFKLAEKHQIPVLLEPTDIAVSKKAFETSHWKAIKFITPNINELRHIATKFGIQNNDTDIDNLQEAALLAKELCNYIDIVLVTVGADGVIIARKAEAGDKFFKLSPLSNIQVRHYPVERLSDVVNVSGAGDCLVGGIIAAILGDLSEEVCMSVGFAAAITALKSSSAVADHAFDKQNSSWYSKAKYTTLML